MNSTIASNINGGTLINNQVAGGSHSSLLLSSIDFSLTETKTNFVPTSHQGKYLIKLSGKEEMFNGQHKNKELDQNKNPVENVIVNGNKEKSSEDTIPVPKCNLYTGKIQVEWNQVHKIGAGLHNLGNTCFMNTVIQCLTYCPPLANYMLQENDHNQKCSEAVFCMMCVLQRHMKKAISNPGNVIKPLDVHSSLKSIVKHFTYGRQEDAHEFLRYVIDNLWKSCLPQTNGVNKLDAASKETTIVNRIFGGYHRSQVTCLKCKKDSNTFDHFMDFILDIKQNVSSLEKALEKFTQPELLDQENCYKCIRCKMKVPAQKRFSVYRPPTVATFQLKRFDYNRQFGGKITKHITYPEKLNLRPYMSEKGEPVWYRLNAVIVHSGPSCNAGHYFCYVKNSNGCWYVMDDSRVLQVSLNQVLNQGAYVLFYIKVPSDERTQLKKNIENKSSFLKGVVSNNHFEKSPNTNVLKSPLSEKPPFANSNHIIGSPSIAKKFNGNTTPTREKMSFGFRPGLSASAYTPKSNKISPSESVSKSQNGLVPYNEDTSDSNEGDEGKNSFDKNKSTTEVKLGLSNKTSFLESYSNSPRLEIKKKLPVTSVFQSPSSSLTKSVPKVSVNGNWIVTRDVSDIASCSSNKTNSDWKVTAIDDDSSVADDVNQRLSKTVRSSVEKSSSRVSATDFKEEQLTGSAHENSSSIQNCSFRDQKYQFNSLSRNEGTSVSPIKRKYNDSYSKVSKDSTISEHFENKLSSSVPKKTKYSEKFSLLTQEIGLKMSRNLEKDSPSPQKKFSVFSGESDTRTLINGVPLLNSATGLSSERRTSSGTTHSLDDRKSSFSPEKGSLFSKGKYKEKNGFIESKSSHYNYYNGKGNISNHVKNDSLYGANVPTWKGKEFYRPSVVSSYEQRRSFDDYDQEFDRGKVRKPKIKNDYKYFKSKNPFQSYADRHHSKKYNGYDDHYNKHGKSSYDLHYNWKSKHNYQNNYHRFKKHHRRY